MSKRSKKVREAVTEEQPQLTNKDYERELKKLHVELVNLQEWVKQEGLKICIVFEGRDGAGKGGTIKAIADRVSPRVFAVYNTPLIRADTFLLPSHRTLRITWNTPAMCRLGAADERRACDKEA